MLVFRSVKTLFSQLSYINAFYFLIFLVDFLFERIIRFSELSVQSSSLKIIVSRVIEQVSCVHVNPMVSRSLFKVCMLVSICLKTGVAVRVFLQISFYGVREQPCRERWAQNSWAASACIDMTWGLPVSSVVSDLIIKKYYFFLST